MTQAKAQTCAAAIIGAGYDVRVHQSIEGTWTVRAISPTGMFTIPSAQIASLVASQVVNGNVVEVEFS